MIVYWTISAIFLQFVKRCALAASDASVAEAYCFPTQHAFDIFASLIFLKIVYPDPSFWILLGWTFVQIVFRDGDFKGIFQEKLGAAITRLGRGRRNAAEPLAAGVSQRGGAATAAAEGGGNGGKTNGHGGGSGGGGGRSARRGPGDAHPSTSNDGAPPAAIAAADDDDGGVLEDAVHLSPGAGAPAAAEADDDTHSPPLRHRASDRHAAKLLEERSLAAEQSALTAKSALLKNSWRLLIINNGLSERVAWLAVMSAVASERLSFWRGHGGEGGGIFSANFPLVGHVQVPLPGARLELAPIVTLGDSLRSRDYTIVGYSIVRLSHAKSSRWRLHAVGRDGVAATRPMVARNVTSNPGRRSRCAAVLAPTRRCCSCCSARSG